MTSRFIVNNVRKALAAIKCLLWQGAKTLDCSQNDKEEKIRT
jgi:hypothetical protein